MDRAQVDGQEVEEERALRLRGQRDHLAAVVLRDLAEDPLQVRRLPAQTGTVVDDLAVDLLGHVVDVGHRKPSFTARRRFLDERVDSGGRHLDVLAQLNECRVLRLRQAPVGHRDCGHQADRFLRRRLVLEIGGRPRQALAATEQVHRGVEVGEVQLEGRPVERLRRDALEQAGERGALLLGEAVGRGDEVPQLEQRLEAPRRAHVLRFVARGLLCAYTQLLGQISTRVQGRLHRGGEPRWLGVGQTHNGIRIGHAASLPRTRYARPRCRCGSRRCVCWRAAALTAPRRRHPASARSPALRRPRPTRPAW